MVVNGPSVYGSYVGESEANLRKIFADAVREASERPTVLFIDEIVCGCECRVRAYLLL